MTINNQKYIILLGDGMADYPLPQLNGQTPLEFADTPNMDFLAANGLFGQVQTVPEGMSPGSDTANLSIFSYDPKQYYTGRAPLEALNLDIDLGPNDVAFRCNIVTIKNNKMADFTANHIETDYSDIIINELKKSISRKNIEFYTGVSYRNIMVWKDFPYQSVPDTTPPHDIQDRDISPHLPQQNGCDVLNHIMQESQSIIKNSNIINEKSKIFTGKPGSIWLWGGGRKPRIETLKEKYGLYGHTISAVDLIHGIGKAAGLSPLNVPGATGYIDTNYTGKAQALIDGIENANFIYLHVESPDESGHEGNVKHKLQAIEDFDQKIVGPVLKGLKKYPDYTVLLLPDHATPIEVKTHTSDPVPFCIYKNDGSLSGKTGSTFNEKSARESTVFIKEGHTLIDIMLNGKH